MILLVALIFIAALANGLGDRIKFHDPFPKSHFWSAGSWVNVYKNGDPKQGAKHFLSTSVFAFLYDGWHLCKFIMIESFMIALVLSCARCESLFSYCLMYLIYRSVFWIGFKITYK